MKIDDLRSDLRTLAAEVPPAGYSPMEAIMARRSRTRRRRRALTLAGVVVACGAVSLAAIVRPGRGQTVTTTAGTPVPTSIPTAVDPPPTTIVTPTSESVIVMLPDGKRYQITYPRSLDLLARGIHVDPPSGGTFLRGVSFGRPFQEGGVAIVLGACAEAGSDTATRRYQQDGPGSPPHVSWCDPATRLHISADSSDRTFLEAVANSLTITAITTTAATPPDRGPTSTVATVPATTPTTRPAATTTSAPVEPAAVEVPSSPPTTPSTALDRQAGDCSAAGVQRGIQDFFDAFDAGDLGRLDTMTAPPNQFRFASFAKPYGTDRAQYTREYALQMLQVLHDNGVRVDSTTLEANGRYGSTGMIKLDFDCSNRQLRSIAWLSY